MNRFHPTNLRAAWWAVRTARRTRRVLKTAGFEAALPPPPPPPLPVEAERGVRGALRRYGESCLVNAIVLQAWEAAHGRRRDLVIGTTGPQSFSAHAWLDGDPVAPADDPGEHASLFDVTGGVDIDPERRSNGADTGGYREGAATSFRELVRRPAPDYHRASSTPL